MGWGKDNYLDPVEKMKRTKRKMARMKKDRERSRKRYNQATKIEVPHMVNRVGQHYLAGATQEEIAEILDISVSQVRKYIQKYNEAMMEIGEDVRALHEKHRREFYPLWKESVLHNLSAKRERTTLAIGDSLAFLPQKEVDADELLKGQTPIGLVMELINKMLEHPVMGPQLIRHVNSRAAIMSAEVNEGQETMQIEQATAPESND